MNILITAGPTIEDIDPVRFISNRASGKLGVELAAAALKAGHRATLVHGPVGDTVNAAIAKLARNKRATIVPVRSAAEMHRAVMAHLRGADGVIMSAAVADFTPASFSVSKLKKAKQGLILTLKPTVDILRDVGRRKGKRSTPVLIGFALETGTGRTSQQRRASQTSEALRKLRDKNCDAIVLDSPKAMGASDGDFRILFRDGSELDCTGMSKMALAGELVKLVAAMHQKIRQSAH